MAIASVAEAVGKGNPTTVWVGPFQVVRNELGKVVEYMRGLF